MVEKNLICLQAEDSLLKKKFRDLSTFSDVASLLEISPKFLHYILNVEKMYSVFYIPKKNGGQRKILSPSKNLKIIQKKMAYILTLSSTVRKSSHGFVKNKSIISNASVHQNKNLVLNFDFKNYFDQFHQGKVIGFLRSYYKFNNEVVGTLVSIFCYNNILPQGAPTSPILTNILTYNFDKEMEKICKKKNYVYSRYVDDVTISSNSNNFHRSFVFTNENGGVELGNKINRVLKDTGFEINMVKTRLRNRYENQTVTGLTVNKFPNVQREYIRKIRAILHNLSVNEDELAQEIFDKHYHIRHSKNLNVPDKYRVVKGMIEFVAQVRGKDDMVYRKLATNFNKLNLPASVFEINLYSKEELFQRNNCLVIEVEYELHSSEDDFEIFGFSASSFILKGIGVITSAHTFKTYYENIEELNITKKYKLSAYRENEYIKKRNLEVLYIDFKLDFAICRVEGINHLDFGFESSKHIQQGQTIKLLGFPRYNDGNQLSIEKGNINQVIIQPFNEVFDPVTGDLGFKQKRYGITSTIFSGNSGGPILNGNNQVVGIATKGTTEDAMEVNTIISIEDVLIFGKY